MRKPGSRLPALSSIPAPFVDSRLSLRVHQTDENSIKIAFEPIVSMNASGVLATENAGI